MKKARHTIQNEEGLHARPATDFCQTAMKFKCNITVLKDGVSYQAKSILSVLCMGAAQGQEIELVTDGEDEDEALKALIQVLENV